jgi:YD repeat-containing protein
MNPERYFLRQMGVVFRFFARLLRPVLFCFLLLLAPFSFSEGVFGNQCPPDTSCVPGGGGIGGNSSSGNDGFCAPSAGGDPSPCGGDGPGSQAGAGFHGAGNPINLITGNKYQREDDLAALPGVLGLEIVRHYNSRYAADNAPGVLGRGWKLSYETVLYARRDVLHIVQADGTRISFDRDPKHPGLCSTNDPGRGHVLIRRSDRGEEEYTWVWTRGEHAGRRLEFNARGRLVRIQAAGGEFVNLSYNRQGYLERVTDPQGRILRLNYPDRSESDAVRFRGVASIDSPVGRYTYTYGDAEGGALISPVRRLAVYQEPDKV